MRAPKRNTSRKRITDGHGSATMQDLLGMRKAARLEREKADEARMEKAVARAAAAAQRDAQDKVLFDAWKQCSDECCCDAAEGKCVGLYHPWYHLCVTCGDLKKSLCRKEKCCQERDAATGDGDGGGGGDGNGGGDNADGDKDDDDDGE